MRVLIVGSGGREHALAWAIAASPLLVKLFCAPGNAGIAAVADCIAIDAADHAGLIAFCRAEAIDFVVIGPEGPLVAGLGDELEAAGLKYFGPSKAAARLEGSKAFTKDLARDCGIPTAPYGRFTDRDAALAYVRHHPVPIVVKADGLAAGKGVVIAPTHAAATDAVEACFAGAFGSAGAEIVIEAFLEGEEVSFFVLTDGTSIVPLATAQDHKRVGDGDTGPNTGGMGAYSPAPAMTADLIEQTLRQIIRPTVDGLRRAGTPFKGVLFAGLMVTREGPKLIEYNVRFGDPETQVLLMRLKSDLLAALLATADGVLASFDLRWHDGPALAVVMASRGYPGAYDRGSEIRGLERSAQIDGVEVFHAGTMRDGDRVLANGGRVLTVTARGATLAEARDRAYRAVDLIDWPEGFCRRDIGWRALKDAG